MADSGASGLEQRDLGRLSFDDHRRDQDEIEEHDADDLQREDQERDRGEELLGLVVVQDPDDLSLDAGSIDLLGDGFEGGAEAHGGQAGFIGDKGAAFDLGVDLQASAKLGHVAGHGVDYRRLGREEGKGVGLFDGHVEVIASDSPIAFGVVDWTGQAHDTDLNG